MCDINTKNKQYFAFAAPALLLAFISGCGHSEAASAPSASLDLEKPALTTVRPERKTLVKVIEQPGVIEGFEQTVLSAKISGYLNEHKFNIGDRVTKDQVIATLSVPEMVEELKQKVAAVAQSEAEVVLSQRMFDAAEAAVNRAEANLKLAEAGKTRAEASYVRWSSELERNRVLVRRNAGDQQTLDQAQDQFKSAEAAKAENDAAIQASKAARAESIAQRDRYAADIKVAEAKLAVAKADCDRMKANLDYAEIKAPYNGILTKRHVESGTLLQTTGGASMIFTIVRDDLVRIFIEVPESEAVYVKRDMPAGVRLQALADQEFSGKVARTSWALDSQARTMRTEIDLPNPDGRFRPGMYAMGRLTIEHPDLLTVPASVVWTQDDQPMVLCVEGGVMKRTPVKTGIRQGGLVQLLKKAGPIAQPGQPTEWVDFRGDEELILTSSPGALPDGQKFSREAEPSARR